MTTGQNIPALPKLGKLVEQRSGAYPEPGPLQAEVLQYVVLDEIAGRLDELGQLTAAMTRLLGVMEASMERTVVGKLKPKQKLIAGDAIQKWEIVDEVGFACCSATIYNDGGDSVWVALNDMRDGFQELKADESMDLDFHGKPVIERMFFYTTPGGEANLRIPLEY